MSSYNPADPYRGYRSMAGLRMALIARDVDYRGARARTREALAALLDAYEATRGSSQEGPTR